MSRRILIAVAATAAVSAPIAAWAQGGDPGSAAGHGDVRIVRDHYGVPHVYADTVFGLFFGYGRSIAEDRLFQIEMARRSTQGLVAEVLGPAYADYDAGVRKAFLPASIRRQLARLSADDLAIFEGYAAGVNAWIDEVEANPGELLPRQFIDYDFGPARWTGYDVAMVFVGTMANRYGDFNTELENAGILSALRDRHDSTTASRIFDALLPRWQPKAPTTIPKGEWMTAAAGMSETPAAAVHADAPAGAVVPRRHSGFSNCIALSRGKADGAASILVNGPQFGWFVPAYVYSIGLHGAGFDMVGNTPFGYPVLLFGHNSRIAWGSTWGAGDVVDVYAERLKPDDSGQYWYDGAWRRLRPAYRDHRVRGGRRSKLPCGDRCMARSWTRIRRPVSPMRGTEPGTASSCRHFWRGCIPAGHQDFRGWLARAADSTQSINWYYADVDGNVGYAYTGYYPDRAAGHDNRLPATGDGLHGLAWSQAVRHEPPCAQAAIWLYCELEQQAGRRRAQPRRLLAVVVRCGSHRLPAPGRGCARKDSRRTSCGA